MRYLLRKYRDELLAPVATAINRFEQGQLKPVNSVRKNVDAVSQLILKNQYKALSKNDLSKYSFNEVGFRIYSQNSEDGILLFIFSLIGAVNKYCVEICAGNGIQCNTANLIIHHGWNGLLFDGNKEFVEKGNEFYKNHPDTFTLPPRFVNAWITKNNINELITTNGMLGEIDFLSLDIDGVDYWIWDAINCISPRVVVAEVQCIWGNEKSVTVPYSDEFKTQFVNGFGIYSGASLPAFVKLAKKKGYRLIGVEKYGFNAFFMRNDVGYDIFPEENILNCIDLPFVKWAKEKFLPMVKDLPWEEI